MFCKNCLTSENNIDLTLCYNEGKGENRIKLHIVELHNVRSSTQCSVLRAFKKYSWKIHITPRKTNNSYANMGFKFTGKDNFRGLHEEENNNLVLWGISCENGILNEMVREIWHSRHDGYDPLSTEPLPVKRDKETKEAPYFHCCLARHLPLASSLCVICKSSPAFSSSFCFSASSCFMYEDIANFGSGVAGATAGVVLGPAGAFSQLLSSLIDLQARRTEHRPYCFKILSSLIACLILRVHNRNSIFSVFIWLG
jgi:hypothetical protein